MYLSKGMRNSDFAHRSPAAADGNELNMSGCLGAGASLQQVLSLSIMNNMAVTYEKYGCCNASSAVILLSGSYVNRDESRSIPAIVKNGNFWRN